MRLPKTIAHPTRSARPLLAGLALATAFLALAGHAHAQATKAAVPSGPPRPIEEYIPAGYDTLVFHVAGTEANEDAWKKTAAYKILNETNTGKMLEAVLSQTIDHYGSGTISFKGAELVQMIKHVFTKGMVVASSGEKGAVVVIRGVTDNKPIQGLFRRMTLSMNGANSAEKLSIVEGHKIVEASTGTGAARKSTNFWWIEETRKQDLVLTNNAESAAQVLKVLDGQSPNISKAPTYQASLKLNDAITPQITAFLDSKKLPNTQGGPLLQLQMGFENDAMLTVMKISAPKPHPGALALLDQTPLDKAAYPAIPDGAMGFMEMAVDLAPAYDGLLDAFKKANPQGAAKFEEFANSMKTKARIKLKEDLLANIGPRAYFFMLPKAASSGGIASLIPAAAGAQVPRGALVMEVKDPVVVGKALDELILLANKELKTMTPPTPPGGAAGAAPGGPGRAQGPGGDDEGGRGGSRGSAPAATFEFKAVNASGTGKQYILSMPPDLAKQLGSQLRPSIRLSGKQLVFGLTPDVARLAVEAKKPWTPSTGSSDLVGAFPAKLLALSISDQADATSDLLATLPGKIQSMAAIAALAMSGKANPAAAGQPGASGPGGVVAGGPPAAMSSGGPAAMAAGGAVAPGGPPAASPGGGRRDDIDGPASGGGGNAAAGATGPAGPLTFQIAPDLMPKPEDIKSKLFPTSFAIASDDQSVTILWRTAFIDAGDTATSAVVVALLLPAVQAARDAARRAAGLPPGPALSVPGGQPGGVAPPSTAPGGAVAPGGPAGPGGARRGGRRSDID